MARFKPGDFVKLADGSGYRMVVAKVNWTGRWVLGYWWATGPDSRPTDWPSEMWWRAGALRKA